MEWLLLDLTDLESITTAASELKRKENRVDILSMYQKSVSIMYLTLE